MEQSEYYKLIDEVYANHVQAEPVILQLITKSRDEYGEDSVFYASMLSEMGGYLRSAGRYEESQNYFEMACEKLKSAVGAKNPEYATAINNLAGTYRLQKKYDQARGKFLEALEIYRNTVGENHMLYAAALNNLSLIAMDQGDYSSAAGFMEQTTQILKMHPECREEYATMAANLGSLYSNLGKPQKALESLREARALYENELGTGTPHYYIILNSMGIAYYQMADYPEAVGLFQKAAEEAWKMFGNEAREYQVIMKHLAKAKEMLESEGKSVND